MPTKADQKDAARGFTKAERDSWPRVNGQVCPPTGVRYHQTVRHLAAMKACSCEGELCGVCKERLERMILLNVAGGGDGPIDVELLYTRHLDDVQRSR